nr:hypothetical protein Iba_chr14eCG2800 [Ipomoea batatas]
MRSKIPTTGTTMATIITSAGELGLPWFPASITESGRLKIYVPGGGGRIVGEAGREETGILAGLMIGAGGEETGIFAGLMVGAGAGETVRTTGDRGGAGAELGTCIWELALDDFKVGNESTNATFLLLSHGSHLFQKKLTFHLQSRTVATLILRKHKIEMKSVIPTAGTTMAIITFEELPLLFPASTQILYSYHA